MGEINMKYKGLLMTKYGGFVNDNDDLLMCYDKEQLGKIFEKLTELETVLKDVDFIILKMRRIRGFKAEYDRNLDFSIVYDRLKKVCENV